jgi:tRNA threonylcarbamoyladenosine biosynthesis protein TsaB
MRILAFDTATPATTVALLDPEHGLELEARDDPPRGQRPRHASRLMPLIVELLDRSGTSWAEVDRIAVGVGPGTFTGMRIGLATAHALARARGIPLVGISTLRSLATNVDDHDRITVAVLDARRREVFAAAWDSETAETLIAPAALAPDRLVTTLAELARPVLALGDGAVEFRQVLARSGAFVPEDGSELHRVTAANHCRLAHSRPAQDPEEVRPEYLRLPDAELARRAADKQ